MSGFITETSTIYPKNLLLFSSTYPPDEFGVESVQDVQLQIFDSMCCQVGKHDGNYNLIAALVVDSRLVCLQVNIKQSKLEHGEQCDAEEAYLSAKDPSVPKMQIFPLLLQLLMLYSAHTVEPI